MIPKRNCFLLFKRVSLAVIFLVTCSLLYLAVRYFADGSSVHHHQHVVRRSMNPHHQNVTSVISNSIHDDSVQQHAGIDYVIMNSSSPPPETSYKVHVFYYPWYGNPEFDSGYLHWNHEYLPQWDKNDKNVYPTGRHEPPEDIGANFYPLLGCYSSNSSATVSQHMEWIKSTGAGVLVVSWYPPDQADKQGKPFDKLFPLFLDTAAKYDLKIAFHIEPYEGRTPENLKSNLEYIIQKYGDHPAMYKLARSSVSQPLPVFYIYDSYLSSSRSWSSLLSLSGKHSVRHTHLDGIFLGLVVELRHKQDMVTGGFDGFYTYFAANDFTYGSSWKNWKSLSSFARKNRLLFVPSVGPGYVDTSVRPWNAKNTRERRGGKYYRIAWKTALQSQPGLISITSFNEWHEGTQIEPAIPKKSTGDHTYEDYSPNGPDFYLTLTREFVSAFTASSADPLISPDDP